MTGLVIVNFSHPLTAAQKADIRDRLDREIDRVIDIPADFDHAELFDEQARTLIDAAGLSPAEWQTVPLLINPPSFSPIVAVVLAQLHGLMGRFPTILRLRPVPDVLPEAFEVAEIIALNRIRFQNRAARTASPGGQG